MVFSTGSWFRHRRFVRWSCPRVWTGNTDSDGCLSLGLLFGLVIALLWWRAREDTKASSPSDVKNRHDKPQPAASNADEWTALPPLEPGTVVAGRYRIRHRVDWDCWHVFSAVELQTQREVLLMTGWFKEDESRFHCIRQTSEKLNHRRFTTVLDSGLADNSRPFLVEEKVDGHRIIEIVRDRKLSLAGIFDVMEAVAEAIDIAHSKEICHLDIGPIKTLVPMWKDRLVLREAKLTKYNLDSMPKDYLIGACQRRFLSPEEIRGEACTPATDVYRFGTLSYFLVFGKSPFASDNIQTFFWRITKDEVNFPESPRVPREMRELISWCMSKQPADRPPDGQLLFREFRALRERVGPPPKALPQDTAPLKQPYKVPVAETKRGQAKYWCCHIYEGESKHSQDRVLSDKTLKRLRAKGIRVETFGGGPFRSEKEADDRIDLRWEATMDNGEN